MDDEKIYRQARMYLEGQSLRQIAAQEGVSHVTIHYNLVVKLKDCDLPLYIQVIAKLNDNTPDSIEKAEVAERVIKAYHLSVVEGLPIEEIAARLDSSPFTIYRDLTVRLPKLHNKSPEKVTKEMLEISERTLSQRSLDCLIPKGSTPAKKTEKLKSRLDRIITDEQGQYKFLTHAMLIFRVTPKTMSAWLDMDENEFYIKLMKYSGNLDRSFQYMVLYELPDQGEALKRFESYYGSLLKAKMYKQRSLFVSLFEMIGDKDYLKVKQEILITGSISKVIDVVVQHILKYSLDPNKVAEDLGIRGSTFATTANWFLAKHHDLRNRYENLVAALPEFYFKAGGR
ncbi:MAG: hypothetical protein K2M17_02215 [Bacilli bacterium]|nr:hypothetical protein [Bacilli bacterium]